MLDNNPLRQYFRRPALYLKLPSAGKFYPPGALDLPNNGEIPVYPMTAIDDITSKTPDSLYNGVAVVEIIKSCLPNIKDPWAIPSVDLDAVLVAIRAASTTDGLEVNSTCPNCSASNEYKVNLSGVLSTIKAGDYDTLLNLGDLKIKFKPLTYRESNEVNIAQIEIQKTLQANFKIEDEEEKNNSVAKLIQKLNEMAFDVVANCVEYIETPTMKVTEKEFIEDYLKNCGKNTFEEIKNKGLELKSSSETKPLHLKCADCGHEYDQIFTLNISDFFD